MNTPPTKKPKDRILDASAKLFYGHDAHTIGVDKICEVANVSKRTLYKHFPSKEALVSATIFTMANAWPKTYTSSDSNSPVERITYVFKMLEQVAESEDFYGCIFMNTSIELRGSNTPATDVARDAKDELCSYFKQQALLMQVKNPDLLAEQLLVLFDGCIAWIVMRQRFPVSAFKTLSVLFSESKV
jgi:AcrR family transcriptional regulator